MINSGFFQTLWKWLEQGGQAVNAAGNGHNISGNGGSTIAGVVGLNEANLHAIDAKNTATTWRKNIFFSVKHVIQDFRDWELLILAFEMVKFEQLKSITSKLV